MRRTGAPAALGEHVRAFRRRETEHGTADHLLAVAVAIDRSRVDPIDAAFDCTADRRDGVPVVLGSDRSRPAGRRSRDGERSEAGNAEGTDALLPSSRGRTSRPLDVNQNMRSRTPKLKHKIYGGMSQMAATQDTTTEARLIHDWA